MTSTKAREAFDLTKESEKVRERYGLTRFGQCCLLARRLVEAREQERRHLAWVLHDELAQSLSAMSATAASIKLTASTRPDSALGAEAPAAIWRHSWGRSPHHPTKKYPVVCRPFAIGTARPTYSRCR